MTLEFSITRNILGSGEKLWNHKYWVQFWKDKLSIADIIFLHKLAFLIHKKKKCFYSPKYFVKMWFWSFSSLILDFGGKILNHYFYDHLGLIFFSIEDILFLLFFCQDTSFVIKAAIEAPVCEKWLVLSVAPMRVCISQAIIVVKKV